MVLLVRAEVGILGCNVDRAPWSLTKIPLPPVPIIAWPKLAIAAGGSI